MIVSSQVRIRPKASNFGACEFRASDLIRTSAASNQGHTSTPASSHPLRVQASESKLRISIASNIHAGFVASKLRSPSFEFRSHQTSTLASSHPSFGIQASNFDRIKPPRRLQVRRIHLASKHPSCIGIQASIFDLCGNRCARSAIASVLYTFIGNDGLSPGAPALTHRPHPLSPSAPALTWRQRPALTWRAHPL